MASADIEDEMGWIRRRRTLNEELLAEGPRLAEAGTADGGEKRPKRAIIWIVRALLVLGLLAAERLPSWAKLVVGVLVVGHLFSIFVHSTRKRAPNAATGLRVVLVVWLLLSVVVTALVAAGGFQQDHRALLGIVWPVLILIWMAYRIRAARVTARADVG
jgi:hypothetical protein